MNSALLLEKIRYCFVENSGIKQAMQDSRGGTLDKMVEINEQGKLFYTVIPKAANSSIKRLFWADLGVYLSAEETMQTVHRRKKAIQPTTPVSQLTDRYIARILADDQWLKFSFVRNPYTRLLSAYKDKILDTSRNRNFLKRMQWEESRLPDFDEFVNKIALQPEKQMDWHWRPQHSLLMMDLINYDFIGKIENFREDIAPVLSRLHLEKSLEDELLGVRTNSTERSAGPDGKKPAVILSAETAGIIYKKYERDFLIFGYGEDSYKP